MPHLSSFMNLWPTQSWPLAQSVEVTQQEGSTMGHYCRESLEILEKPSELDLGGNSQQLWPWEGRAERSQAQAGPHGQGGWWLRTTKVLTWNPAGWASLSHFLPVPTLSLSHLQEVGAGMRGVKSPGSSFTPALTPQHDPHQPLPLARAQFPHLTLKRPD